MTLAGHSLAPQFESLRGRLHGALVSGSDAGYDDARAAWNLAADQQPRAVVLAESVADIQAVIAFAAEHGLRVVPQATGHHAAACGPLEDSILLRTGRMRDVAIDPVARTARAEAGAVWGDVVAPAAEHGLAALAGSAADVGVVGYTLGGGMGWLGRRYGLAANRVTAIEAVAADGRARRVDADSDPDLFWALRGGGGTYAVVTAIEFELLEVPSLHAGTMFWPLERAGEILRAWQEWTGTVPEDVTSCWRVLQFPPLPQVPDALRGQSFACVEAVVLRDGSDAGELLEPLRRLEPARDTFADVGPAALLDLHMDPPGPVPGVGDGFLLDELPEPAQQALVAIAGPGSGSPMLSVTVRHAGGALGRHAAGHGALPAVPGRFALFAVGMAPVPEAAAAVAAHAGRIRSALAPWRAERGFSNFDDRVVAADEFLSPEACQLAAEVKAYYDPDDLIHAVHPIAS